MPDRATVVPDRATVLSDEAAVVPDRATVVPDRATVVPDSATVVPDKDTVLPDMTTVLPDRATVVPDRATGVPDRATVVPDRATVVPDRATVVPDRATVVPSTLFRRLPTQRHETTTAIRSTLLLHSNQAPKSKNSESVGAKKPETKNPGGPPGSGPGQTPEGRLSTLWRPSLQNSTLDLDFSSWACPAVRPSTARELALFKTTLKSATCKRP